MSAVTSNHNGDRLHRFTFEGLPVRGQWVRLTDTVAAANAVREYPQEIKNLLNQMFAAVAMFADNLKFEGAVALQSRGNGALIRSLAECREHKYLRGIAHLSEEIEAPAERDLSVYRELRASKETIEAHLPGKKVTHLCFPWYDAASFAVAAAVKAGFEACYFGTVSGRGTNRPGDSPLYVTRVEDIFLERLPGKGRKSVLELLKKVWDLRHVGQMLKPLA